MTRLSFLTELIQIRAEIARLKRREAVLTSLPRDLPLFPVFRREKLVHYEATSA